MAKLAPRRVSPVTTLKQLKHIVTVAPRCDICGERVHSYTDQFHIGMNDCIRVRNK